LSSLAIALPIIVPKDSPLIAALPLLEKPANTTISVSKPKSVTIASLLE
jgi:hypothetical protein